MRVALIQTDIIWENAVENRLRLGAMIQSVNGKADIMVLPEMFTTGFSMNAKALAEDMDGPTVAWMKGLARQTNAAITGSIIIKENGRYFNRLLFAMPDGTVETYDKKHLFTLAGEDKNYTGGTERKIVEFMGFKICLMVCYDLRFPVFARNSEGYDLLIYVASWPEQRIFAWDTLLKARAIENICYVAGVNRIGEDGNGYPYPGHSQIIDFLGKTVQDCGSAMSIHIARLDKEALLETRKKLGFLDDQDLFLLL